MDITPFLHGALYAKETPEGLYPCRFTEKQAAFYAAETKHGGKVPGSTSMRLEFYTDAAEFSFDYTAIIASTRRYFYIDASVDGVLIYHEGTESTEGHSGTFHMTLSGDGKRHRVTVYLPNLFSVRIRELSFSEGAVTEPVTKKCRMLTLGDSITQGCDGRFPSQSYANQIADYFEAEQLNQSIAGDVFRPGMLDRDLPFDPDVITVAYGTNDWRRTGTGFAENAVTYFKMLREQFPRPLVFAITPIWRGNADAASFEAAREAVRKAANDIENCVIIEGAGLVPHLPCVFADNHLHPDDLGNKFYAAALIREMKPYMEKLWKTNSET